MKKIMFLAMGFVLTFMLIMPVGSSAGNFIGTYCFQWDNWPCNVLEMNVDQVGSVYQISGQDLCSNAPLDGSGVIVGNNINIVATVADPSSGNRVIWAITLDSTTLNGTGDGSWMDYQHNIIAPYLDEPLSNVACNAVGASSDTNFQGK